MSSTSGVFRACRALFSASKLKNPNPFAESKPKTPPKPKTTKPSSSASKTKSKPGSSKSPPPPPKQSRVLARPTGILKLAPVSPALHRFLGVPESARTDAVKKVWDYIKLHNLQNPTNKREIYCDDKLKTIFEGREKVGFLEIGRLLSHHFVKTG